MSGGVDSSVVALLLKRQGHEVCGLFMKNWEDWDHLQACPATQDFADMAQVCEQIGIEYRQVNLAKQYWRDVFSRFISQCKRGLTPNPDILCNREIKFKAFLEQALQWGADMVATGHYCQIDHSLPFPRLQKALDSNKDQSYFLQNVTEQALRKTLFPIGHLHKEQVRKIARDWNLPTHDKRDSTGICFLGKRPFADLLGEYLHQRPGPIRTSSEGVVGEHRGLSFYTIGQRKGLGLGGAGGPWFVVDKDLSSNTLMVEKGAHHPALYTDRLWAERVDWINPHSLHRFREGQSYSLQAKIRYRQQIQDCQVSVSGEGGIEVAFGSPQRAVTLGQYICLYEGDICLGGGQITRRGEGLHRSKGLQQGQGLHQRQGRLGLPESIII